MIKQPDMPLILASASPRRKDLLHQLGLEFKIIPSHIDESMLPGETSLEHVMRLSEAKGNEIAKGHPHDLVISSDTIVVFEGHILGKPNDKDHAFKMLNMLSGKEHEVISAFSLICKEKSIEVTEYEKTKVRFRKLGENEILDYIEGGSPMDKAGAYGIQDLKANLVESIEGCFYNVIGFPVAKFKEVWDRLPL